MPNPRPTLSVADVCAHVAEHVFGSVADPFGLGVELEWLTSQGGREHRLAESQATSLIAELTPLPHGGRLTVEPGGQLELSAAPFRTVDELCRAASAELALLDRACDDNLVELIALGADPVRAPERVTLAPRYQAMERYFDHLGPAGRTMMCNTAAIQVNVGLGRADQVERRWALANRLGPTLIGCFANSPFAGGLPSGWQSSRLRAWWSLDPSRSAPVPCDLAPIDAWSAYALDTRVMLIRVSADRCEPIIEPLAFGKWLADGHELGWPTADDLAYHLTTLFPPVRPKGWLELRMFDALPDPFWKVAVAVTCALLTTVDAAEEVDRAVTDTGDLSVNAAQLGLGHPTLAQSAREVFGLALQILESTGVDPDLLDLVAAFDDRWVARGRSPADDRLEAWRLDGDLFPPADPLTAIQGAGDNR